MGLSAWSNFRMFYGTRDNHLKENEVNHPKRDSLRQEIIEWIDGITCDVHQTHNDYEYCADQILALFEQELADLKAQFNDAHVDAIIDAKIASLKGDK